MPSGNPSPSENLSHSRWFDSAPLDTSKSNAWIRRSTVSLKYIVRSSQDQVGPFVTAKPISWRTQLLSGSQRRCPRKLPLARRPLVCLAEEIRRAAERYGPMLQKSLSR